MKITTIYDIIISSKKEVFIMWIALIIIAVIIIFAISVYNGLVTSRQKVKNAWSQIDVQLQRRFDLIPNLVESVKGYMKHEEGTLTKVTELRTAWANAKTVSEKAEADNMLTVWLKSIFALSEAYPDLKANQNFLNLQNELSDIENKIAAARRYFNAATREYNTTVQEFPANVLFHKQPEDYFEGIEEAKKAPKVKFD